MTATRAPLHPKWAPTPAAGARAALAAALSQLRAAADPELACSALEFALAENAFDQLLELTDAVRGLTLEHAPAHLRLLLSAAHGAQSHGAELTRRCYVDGVLPAPLLATLARALVHFGADAFVPSLLAACDGSTVNAAAAAALHAACKSAPPNATPLRCWLSGSVSLHALLPALRVGLLRHGFAPEITLGEFGRWHQDLRDDSSDCASARPDILILAYSLSDLIPGWTHTRRDLADVDAALARDLGFLTDSLQAWRAHSAGTVILHTLPAAGLRSYGFLDRQRADGAHALSEKLNAALAALAARIDGVYLSDFADLAAQLGQDAFEDPRRRFFGRYPASAEALTRWGIALADQIRTIRRGPRKVIVTDLDDTFWGGIVGDVGPRGVAVGADYPGNAYLEYQRALLDFRAQGVLLAICSKNDEATALAALNEHPQMAIRAEEFAAHRIGWGPKPQALRELAEELNLGLDALVFIDDSIHERAAVREALPQVLVPELPADPVLRPRFIAELRALWPVKLTQTDLQRAADYTAQKQRDALKARSTNVVDFLASLEQILTFREIGDNDWARAAQMHQRTNQFNTTTRRYSEAELRRIRDAGGRIFLGDMRDRFGDQGAVVLAVVVPEAAATWRLDTFLMSCRVFGRQVEAAFIGAILAAARDAGVTTLQGEFIPTERNGPSARVYEELGFRGPFARPHAPASQWWEAAVAEVRPAAPAVTVQRV